MNEEQKRQFFATQEKPLITVSMKGKVVKMANLPAEARQRIMDRLAEKDPGMAKGQAGILPGLKIDGKQVTRDNIQEFEKGAKPKIEKPKLKEEVKEESKKYTKEELQAIADKEGISGLRKIGDAIGVKFRGIKEAIREILAKLK